MSPLFTDVSVVNKVSNIVTMVIATVDIIYNDDVNGVASVLGFRSYSCSIDLYITFTLLTFFPPQHTRVCDVHVDFFLWKVGTFVLLNVIVAIGSVPKRALQKICERRGHIFDLSTTRGRWFHPKAT